MPEFPIGWITNGNSCQPIWDTPISNGLPRWRHLQGSRLNSLVLCHCGLCPCPVSPMSAPAPFMPRVPAEPNP